MIESGWTCDNSGNPASKSICTTICGDGIITGLETCDDENIDSGDGCSYPNC